MKPISALVPLLFATMALTGCLGGDDAPPSEVMSANVESAPAASATVPEENATDAAATPPEPVVTPYVIDGTLSAYADACAYNDGSASCAQAPTGSGDNGDMLPFTGTLQALHLEITWTSTTPASATLGAYVFSCAESEDGTTCDLLAGLEGSSPLMLDASNLAIPEGSTVMWHVYNPMVAQGNENVRIYAQPEQAYHLEGTVTTLPSA